jgi:hypothetical protein
VPRLPAPRRLVIDADIARSAGQASSRDARSAACRAFLVCLESETRHALATSERLGREWADHASGFAIRWQALMRSRRRLVDVGAADDPELRRSLAQHAASDAQRVRVLKDVHLIETARRTDRVVCSGDERVRSDLRQLARPSPSSDEWSGSIPPVPRRSRSRGYGPAPGMTTGAVSTMYHRADDP